jgi:hypothetical protein
MTYPAEVVQLAVGQGSIRTFTVTVPAGTTPGEYLSSLVLENAVPVQGSGSVAINQVVRQAVPVSIRVPGTSQPAFGFGTASHKVTLGHSVIDVQINNTGNANLLPAGTMLIRDQSGKTVSTAPVKMGLLFAHTDTLVETTLASTLQPGKYSVAIVLSDALTKATATAAAIPFTVTVQAVSASGLSNATTLPQIMQTAGQGVTPYILAAVGLILAAVLVVLFVLLGRLRRAQRFGDPVRKSRRRPFFRNR